MLKKKAVLIVIAFLLLPLACTDTVKPDDTNEVVSIRIFAHLASLEVDIREPQTVQFALTGSQGHIEAPVSIDFHPDSIEAPDSLPAGETAFEVAGLVYGITDLIVRSGMAADTLSVRMMASSVRIEDVASDGLVLGTGKCLQMRARGRDHFGDPVENVPISWNSTVPGVATVDTSGFVRTFAPGLTFIDAILDSGTRSSAMLEVIPDPAGGDAPGEDC